MALVRFTSKAAGEIFMFEENARTLFRILGKDVTREGIITADQVPGALAALRRAVDEERRAAAAPAANDASLSQPDAPDDGRAPFVRLSQRAFPLIEMLERAQSRHADVIWGI